MLLKEKVPSIMEHSKFFGITLPCWRSSIGSSPWDSLGGYSYISDIDDGVCFDMEATQQKYIEKRVSRVLLLRPKRRGICRLLLGWWPAHAAAATNFATITIWLIGKGGFTGRVYGHVVGINFLAEGILVAADCPFN